jgi:putative DNA primase/helicase
MNATQLPDIPLPIPSAQVPGRAPKLARASNVVPRAVEWLFPERVAVGKVTVLVGEAGIGKGEIAADLVARVTRGANWPGRPADAAPVSSVVVVCPDDVREEVMSARLTAAGADLDKVFAVDADRSPETMASVTTVYELDVIKAAIQSLPDCKLVVIDPLAMLLEGLDGKLPGTMQHLLRGLATLAREHRVAIVVTADLNGRASIRSVDRLLATFGTASRSRNVWGVFRESAESDRRVMVSLDRNFGDEAEELSFRLVGAESQAVEWGEAVKTSVDRLLVRRAGFRLSEQEYRDKEEFVTTKLREVLAIGPVKREFFLWLVPGNESQLYRAAERLGVVKHKDGFRGEWYWMLPEHEANWLARDRRNSEEQVLRTARAQAKAAKKQQMKQARAVVARQVAASSAASPGDKPVPASAGVVQNSSPPVEKWAGSFSPPVEEVNCFIGGDPRGRNGNEKQNGRAGRHEARLRDAAG